MDDLFEMTNGEFRHIWYYHVVEGTLCRIQGERRRGEPVIPLQLKVRDEDLLKTHRLIKEVEEKFSSKMEDVKEFFEL